MKKLLILVFIISISLVLLKIFVLTPQGWKADLISPMGQTKEEIVSNPTPSPSQLPKQFNFDRSTDLEKELDSVNPEVLDSDFDE